MCLAKVLQLVSVVEFVVLLEEGFCFEVLVDFLVDYGHFLIKNQLKSK